MRIKLLLLMVIAAVMPVLAQTASLTGTVTDASTGQPVSGATVMLRDQGLSVTTGAAGDFKISNARPGSDLLLVLVYGYNDADREVTVPAGGNVELGRIALTASGNMMADLYEEQADQLFDESALDDEESSAQAIAALTGASDNIYYSAASYNFSPMYFNMRGYDSQYQTTYI
ncbi:MAG: carboxypeptidase-like regulatory domain-containing protein, partial [Muribaculaceae bacterium]|nr:carboxypeptidase-like regulatory domain-containing protein [Muribaculaceae bacterium]